MKPLDLTKPLQTRLGEKAELVYDGLAGYWPLAVVVHHERTGKTLQTCTREGVIYHDETSMNNIMNVPEKRTLWLNVYEDRQTCHHSRAQADCFADHVDSVDRIACIEVTYAEGDGL